MRPEMHWIAVEDTTTGERSYYYARKADNHVADYYGIWKPLPASVRIVG